MDKLEQLHKLIEKNPKYNELGDVLFCRDENIMAPWENMVINELKLFSTQKLCCADCSKCGEFIHHKHFKCGFNLKRKVETFGLKRDFVERQIKRRMTLFPFITYKEQKDNLIRYNLFNCIDNVGGTDYEEMVNTTLCIYCILDRMKKMVEEAHKDEDKLLHPAFVHFTKALERTKKLFLPPLNFTPKFHELYPLGESFGE